MTPTKLFAGAAVAFGTVFTLVVAAQQPAPAGTARRRRAGSAGGRWCPAGPAEGPGAQAGRVAGGGGRGGPGAPLYTDNCSGCHGVDLNGGRAPSLFDPKWLDANSDDKILNAVKNGVPGTEMDGFKAQLTDDQIMQIIQYARSQSGVLTPKAPYIDNPDGMVVSSEKQKFKIEVVTRGLVTPWGIAFLPDGRMLITERPGRLRILDHGKLSDPVKNTPVPHVQQDGGYLDVTVHPDYARNGWIYLSYAEVQPGFVPPPAPPADAAAPAAPAAQPAPAAGGAPGAAPAAGAGGGAGGRGGFGGGRGRGPQIPSNTVIVRGKINTNNEWTDQQVIFRTPSALYVASGVHFGSRFLWDDQHHLFFTLGERGTMTNAQTLTDNNTLGKVHRINDDGTVPKDNPFANQAGADPTIWSYGHRNPQGLAWDPVVKGRLWESEHGPTGGDEINIIVAGHNYGWGVASKGVQPGITKTSAPGMEDPIVYYTPTIAPSGIGFYTGDKYPGWKNTSLFVCALAGQQFRRLEVTPDGKVAHQEVVFSQMGRVHDIQTGPDGLIYLAIQQQTGVQGVPLASDTPGFIVRLIPQ